MKPGHKQPTNVVVNILGDVVRVIVFAIDRRYLVMVCSRWILRLCSPAFEASRVFVCDVFAKYNFRQPAGAMQCRCNSNKRLFILCYRVIHKMVVCIHDVISDCGLMYLVILIMEVGRHSLSTFCALYLYSDASSVPLTHYMQPMNMTLCFRVLLTCYEPRSPQLYIN